MNVNSPEGDAPAMAPAGTNLRLSGWRLSLDRSPVFLGVMLLFLVPFLTRDNGTDPLLPKLFLFKFTVFALAWVWALQAALGGRWTMVRIPAWRPLALLLGWLLLDCFLSPYTLSSRGHLLQALLPFLWFALASVLYREVWRIENLLIVFLAGAFGCSLWAISQKFGWVGDGWDGVVAHQFNGRVVGGLGNPNFLAGYLLAAWPFALALFLRAKSAWGRSWWGLSLVAMLTALFWTGSRSGWLGLAVGTFVFLVTLLPKDKGFQPSAVKAAALFGLVILCASFFAIRTGRLGDLAGASDGAGAFRFQVWRGTWNMIRERPLTGWGPGAFEAAFPDFAPPALVLGQTQRNYVVDHAHNVVLEWTAETGLIGLGLLVWFWAAVLLPWWKLYRGNAIVRPLVAGAFTAFAGVLVSNLLDVNHAYAGTQVPIMFLATLPTALSQRFHQLEGFPIRVRTVPLGRGAPLAVLSTFLLGSLFAWQVQTGVKRQLGDVLLAKALKASEARDWDNAMPLYRQSLKQDPDRLETHYFLGTALLDRAQGPNDLLDAEGELKTVALREPNFALTRFKLWRAVDQLGRKDDAERQIVKAVRKDPYLVLQVPEFEMARALGKAGREGEALKLYDRLALRFPGAFPILLDRGNVLMLLNRSAEARDSLETALYLWPDSVDALLNLGYVALEQGLPMDARQSLEHLQRLVPTDPRVVQLSQAIQTFKGGR